MNPKYLQIFKSLFKGREDVFAIHWIKGKRSGYMPVYSYDPYMYALHKRKGGTMSTYKDKSLLPLTDQELIKHLAGEKLIGIYPLLLDNTSWWITADFDKNKWKEESLAFIEICNRKKIPTYLERSKSGNGAHVWIFFDQPYPAIKSRKLIISLLEKAKVISPFDKGSSFDRLFPNQDYLSGKGLGNLIALPLNKTYLDNGNCCFVNSQFEPYEDQWEFLESIERVSTKYLDNLLEDISPIFHHNQNLQSNKSDKLSIQLNNVITLNRNSFSIKLRDFLKEELNFTNSDFFIKKQSGKSTWKTKSYINTIEENDDSIIISRGFVGRLLRYCKQSKIEFDFKDNRKKREGITFESKINLLEHQKGVLNTVNKKEFGVIVAPPGSGKTIIGLQIIAEKKQPALIIVHRKQLFDQWIERIEAFLGIPKAQIGKVGQGKVKIGKKITIALIQSLSKQLDKENTELYYSFGLILVDECHHVASESYRKTLRKIHTYYQYGLTATPFRKGSDSKLIFSQIGEVIHEIKPQQIENYKSAKVIVRNTQFNFPFNSKTDPFETISKVLIHDSERNNCISIDILHEVKKGKKIVVITERKEHIAILYQILKTQCEIVTLSGDHSEKERKAKWKTLHEGNYQVLITTGQFFGEGVDLQNANCLFLAYPFSFKGKLIQYIGRVQRSEVTPTIYDYHDHKVDYLHRLFLKRNVYYRKLEKLEGLFSDLNTTSKESINDTIIIDKTITVKFEELEFQYGLIYFNYTIKNNSSISFEMENDWIRPEFEVLKPYFAKQLSLKRIKINVYAELQQNEIIAKNATSEQLDQINSSIIESVKFKFVEKELFKPNSEKHTMIDIDELQNNKPKFFDSEEDLLNQLLKNAKYKHSKQLQYLVSKNQSEIVKIRFVLSPFSFVFLLNGEENYHVVLETLDTEEATYLWYLPKDTILKQNLDKVNKDINFIRNKGREEFLRNQPEYFSRVLHDYSGLRKGFIIWKDLLEEKLF